jgi:cell wall-associated NlpC family hydrolase
VASQANLIRQSFKFQGERYGWGHDFNGRDCSGFVSEVYRSMGILLPRNTGDQQRSTAFERIAFDPGLNRQQRLDMLKKLRIGDLVYIPGHVMMVIGSDDRGPWVIHDTHRTNVIIDGRFHNLPSNSVVVTPLLPLAMTSERLYADAVTAVQRILPSKP